MMPGTCSYDPINGEFISTANFKNPINNYRFIYDEHAKEFERLENLPETQPEQHRPFWETDTFNEYDDETFDKKGVSKEIAMILFVILPAGVIFLYLLFHALRECLVGCFY